MDLVLSLSLDKTFDAIQYYDFLEILETEAEDYQLQIVEEHFIISKDYDSIEYEIEYYIYEFFKRLGDSLIDNYAFEMRLGVFQYTNQFSFLNIEISQECLLILQKCKKFNLNFYLSED